MPVPESHDAELVDSGAQRAERLGRGAFTQTYGQDQGQ